jgi:transcriptional regulator with XRE-family HTH domain
MTNRQTRKDYPADVDVSEWQAKQRRDPEFVRAYEELRPEFEVAEQVIKLRLKQKMTQAELAKRSGTKQSGIARLERGRGAKQLSFIERVADSLNASVHIHLKPRAMKMAAKKATPTRRAIIVTRKRSRPSSKVKASRSTTRRK